MKNVITLFLSCLILPVYMIIPQKKLDINKLAAEAEIVRKHADGARVAAEKVKKQAEEIGKRAEAAAKEAEKVHKEAKSMQVEKKAKVAAEREEKVAKQKRKAEEAKKIAKQAKAVREKIKEAKKKALEVMARKKRVEVQKAKEVEKAKKITEVKRKAVAVKSVPAIRGQSSSSTRGLSMQPSVSQRAQGACTTNPFAISAISLPCGSYLSSCNCSYREGVLNCMCKNRQGESVSTRMPPLHGGTSASNCLCYGDSRSIVNCDGLLYCQNETDKRTWCKALPEVPEGCRKCYLSGNKLDNLTCTCPAENYRSVTSTFNDYRVCKTKIINFQGSLKCDEDDIRSFPPKGNAFEGDPFSPPTQEKKCGNCRLAADKNTMLCDCLLNGDLVKDVKYSNWMKVGRSACSDVNFCPQGDDGSGRPNLTCGSCCLGRGASCKKDEACCSGHCYKGECATGAQRGEKCDSTSDCFPGLKCSSIPFVIHKECIGFHENPWDITWNEIKKDANKFKRFFELFWTKFEESFVDIVSKDETLKGALIAAGAVEATLTPVALGQLGRCMVRIIVTRQELIEASCATTIDQYPACVIEEAMALAQTSLGVCVAQAFAIELGPAVAIVIIPFGVDLGEAVNVAFQYALQNVNK